jgi:hypothetical protein
MVNITTRKALTEVNSVIKVLPEELLIKIPKSFIKFVDSNKDNTYEFDLIEPIENNTFLKETEIILGLMYENYWCNSEQKSAYIKADSEALLKEKEKTKGVFNAKPINEVKEKIQQDTLPNEEFSLIEKKETIVSRFLNWIKRLLNKKG